MSRNSFVIHVVVIFLAGSCGKWSSVVYESSRTDAVKVPDGAKTVVDLYVQTISEGDSLNLTGDSIDPRKIRRFGNRLGARMVSEHGVNENSPVAELFAAAEAELYNAAGDVRLELQIKTKAALSSLALRFGDVGEQEVSERVASSIEDAQVSEVEIGGFLQEFTANLSTEQVSLVVDGVVAFGEKNNRPTGDMLATLMSNLPKDPERYQAIIARSAKVMKSKGLSSEAVSEVFGVVEKSGFMQSDGQALAALNKVRKASTASNAKKTKSSKSTVDELSEFLTAAILSNSETTGSSTTETSEEISVSVSPAAPALPVPAPVSNQPPAWSDSINLIAVDENVAITGVQFAASDADGDSLMFDIVAASSTCNLGATWTALPAIGSSSGILTGTPSGADVGSCILGIRVTGGNHSITKQVTVSVGNIDESPVWASSMADFALQEGAAISSVAASATDADGDTVVYELDAAATTCDADSSWSVELSIDPASGAVSGTPSTSNVGRCTVGVKALSTSFTISQTFDIYIYPEPTAFTWTGSGGDDNWSTGANWFGNAAPTNTDIALFSAVCGISGCVVNIDSAIDVDGINIDASFAGSIVQQSGQTITVGAGDYSQAAGTFTGSDASITLGGNFTLAGGTFTSTSDSLIFLASVGTLTSDLTDGLYVSGGSFVHNSGTVNFDVTCGCRSGNWTVRRIESAIALEFNNLTVDLEDTANYGGYAQAVLDINAGDDITVSGTLTIQDGVLANGTMKLTGDIVARQTTDRIRGEGGSANLIFNGSGDQFYTFDSGAGAPVITVSKASGSVQPVGASPMLVDSFHLTSGTFVAPSTTMTLNRTFWQDLADGGFIVEGGSFDHNSGTVAFDISAGVQSAFINVSRIESNIALEFNNLVVDIADTQNYGGYHQAVLYINDGDDITIKGDVTVSDGTIFGGSLKIEGNAVFNYTDDNVHAEGGYATFVFTGTGDQFYTFQAGAEAPIVSVAKPSGSLQPSVGSGMLVDSFHMSSGTFVAPTGDMVINRGFWQQTPGQGFIVEGGTFDHNSGTVVFDTYSDIRTTAEVVMDIDVVTSIVFNNLNIDVYELFNYGNNLAIAQIAAGDTLIVDGNLQFIDGRVDGGTIEVNGNYHAQFADTTVAAGGGSTALSFAGAAQNFTQDASATTLAGGMTIQSGSTVTLQSDIDFSDTLTIDAGILNRSGYVVTGTVSAINGGQDNP